MDARYEKLLFALEEMVQNGTEQLPLVMEEIVRWSFYKNLGISTVCFFVFVLGLKLMKDCFRETGELTKKAEQVKDTEKKKEYEALCMTSNIMAVFFLAVAIVALFLLLPSVGYTIKSVAAPRVVIIEYLRDLSR